MKRARSFVEGQDASAACPGAGITRSTGALPSYQQASTAMDLVPLRPASMALPKPDPLRPTPTQAKESSDAATASSRGTWAVEQTGEHEGKVGRLPRQAISSSNLIKEEIVHEQSVIHRVGGSGQLTLKDIACEPVEAVAERMNSQPEEILEQLKAELREILNGTRVVAQREVFAELQNWVLSRRDLFPESLLRANRNQLQILVALKTGIQAFLLPGISVTQSVLIEVFFHKRCRNMACQSQLPADDCSCDICSMKSGFCNVCMCTICSKFDFDVNTCRWIGCDICSHWTHTECAMKVHQIAMGVSLKGGRGSSEMLFSCKACKHTSELLGWVKDVFRTCAGDWGAEELQKEFNSVCSIFRAAEDSKGRRLFWKSEELLERLKNGVDGGTVCNEMHRFFEDLETEDMEQYKGEDTKMIEPQEACNRIAEVVQEAVAKMEIVAQEKARALKRAHLALEACDKELEEKKRELQELQLEKQRKKQEIEELETIVKLRLDESEMFQKRADDARQIAENLQRIIAADKSEKAEEEYTARYLQLRLNEVEAERCALYEKIRLQEHSRSSQANAPQLGMMGKMQDLLKRAYNPKDHTDPKETP